MSRAAALVLAAGLVPLTSGCIAAAIPLAAGAAIAKARLDRGTSGVVTASVPSGASASAASDLKVVRLATTALPPPDGYGQGNQAAMEALSSYVRDQADIQPGAGKRVSALLARPGDLVARRADCTAATPALFVDLDPGRGTFDPLAPGRPNTALAETLNDLRDSGFAVVWFSRLGENFAGAVRTALTHGGLDPAGQDMLVLMRSIDERKQTRRDDVARLFCPLALVGDERADFDELYLYLKQADTASALDALIGQGWFLASPFQPDPIPYSGTTP